MATTNRPPVPNPFVKIYRDDKVEMAAKNWIQEQQQPSCFLCGSGCSVVDNVEVGQIELFQSFLDQFEDNDNNGQDVCDKCLIIVNDVWALQEQMDKIKDTINEIIQNCVDHIIPKRGRQTPHDDSIIKVENGDTTHGDDEDNNPDDDDEYTGAAKRRRRTERNSETDDDDDNSNDEEAATPDPEIMDFCVLKLEFDSEEEKEIDMSLQDPFQNEQEQEEVVANFQFEDVGDQSNNMNGGRRLGETVTPCSSKFLPYNCGKCRKLFTTHRKLAIHEIAVCDIIWETEELLKLGIVEKKCRYPRCGKVFAFNRQLAEHHYQYHAARPAHVRQEPAPPSHVLGPGPIHCTPKIFPCSICGQAFYVELTLQQHIQTKHDGVKYPCSKCGKQFLAEKACTTHEAIVCRVPMDQEVLDALRIKLTKCGVRGCEEVFGYEGDLIRHIKNKH